MLIPIVESREAVSKLQKGTIFHESLQTRSWNAIHLVIRGYRALDERQTSGNIAMRHRFAMWLFSSRAQTTTVHPTHIVAL